MFSKYDPNKYGHPETNAQSSHRKDNLRVGARGRIQRLQASKLHLVQASKLQHSTFEAATYLKLSFWSQLKWSKCIVQECVYSTIAAAGTTYVKLFYIWGDHALFARS